MLLKKLRCFTVNTCLNLTFKFFFLFCVSLSAQVKDSIITYDLPDLLHCSGERMFISASFRNHMLNGPFTAFGVNGKIFCKGNFENNCKSGEWIYNNNTMSNKQKIFYDSKRHEYFTSLNSNNYSGSMIVSDTISPDKLDEKRILLIKQIIPGSADNSLKSSDLQNFVSFSFRELVKKKSVFYYNFDKANSVEQKEISENIKPVALLIAEYYFSNGNEPAKRIIKMIGFEMSNKQIYWTDFTEQNMVANSGKNIFELSFYFSLKNGSLPYEIRYTEEEGGKWLDRTLIKNNSDKKYLLPYFKKEACFIKN